MFSRDQEILDSRLILTSLFSIYNFTTHFAEWLDVFLSYTLDHFFRPFLRHLGLLDDAEWINTPMTILEPYINLEDREINENKIINSTKWDNQLWNLYLLNITS